MCVKRVISLLVMVCCLCGSLSLTVLAETTTSADPVATTTTTTVEQPTTTTTADTTTTTTARPSANVLQQIKTFMTLTYEHDTITVRVFDENSQPVAKGTVALAVDGEPHSLTTDSKGIATLSVKKAPSEIRASMAMFQNDKYIYESVQASVLFDGPSSDAPENTTPPAGEGTTMTTKVNTTEPPRRTLTTTDPAQGDVTVTETMVVTGTTLADTPKADEVGRAVPAGLAVALIVVGISMVVAAVALLVVFLVRRPRDEESADEVEVTEDAYTFDAYTGLHEPTAADEATRNAESAEEPSAEAAESTGVSLEDLFRK